MKTPLILNFVFLSLVGCSSQFDARKGVYEKVAVKGGELELALPQSLFNKLETLPLSGEAPVAAKEGKQVPENVNPGVMRLAPITVRLMEENVESLHGRNIEIEFAKGGGTLDLAPFVNREHPGDYIFSLALADAATITGLKVYFYNNAKPQKIGSLDFGMSCHKGLDLTSFARQTLFKKGLRVSGRKHIDLNLISGSFLIAYQADEQWYETQISIIDSSLPQKQCRASSTVAFDNRVNKRNVKLTKNF